MNNDTSLALYEAPQAPAIVRPLVDPAAARQAIQQYEQLKAAIVRPSDVVKMNGHDYLCKPFWRRLARFFGLSVELVREERLDLDGKIAYRVTYRSIAPNGQYMDGDGMMVYGEKGQTIEHNIRAIAHTRAKNRAISDLVGGGEVSAEEMPDDDAPRPAQTRPAQSARKPAPPTASATVEGVTGAQWDALKARMRDELGLTNVAAAKAFMRVHLKHDLEGAIPTLAEYDKLVAGVNHASKQKLEAQAKLGRTARPEPASPSADELAAAQADYEASQAGDDFPPDDLSHLDTGTTRP